jgi:hypothetical protein
MGPLTSADFPLYAIGRDVYRRTGSSPLFTAADRHVAAEMVLRLNRDQMFGPRSREVDLSTVLAKMNGCLG